MHHLRSTSDKTDSRPGMLLQYDNGIVVDFSLPWGTKLGDWAEDRCASVQCTGSVIRRSDYKVIGKIIFKHGIYRYQEQKP